MRPLPPVEQGQQIEPQWGRVPATQTAHPWRATLRTVAAVCLGLLPVLPALADALGVAAVGWVAALLAGAAAVTRVLAVPVVDDWLRDHGLLSASPRD